MRTNRALAPGVRKRTHGGAPASRIDSFEELRRTVSTCLLWEDSFYEDGKSTAERIQDLVPKCDRKKVAELAIDARSRMNLRHVPLLVVRELARVSDGTSLVRDTLAEVIQRPDELAEFLSLYWMEERTPISKQVQRGLAKAFTKFTAYQLAKYNQDKAVRLRDVLFLCHAKPKDQEQAEVWKKLVEGTIEAPDTWEVQLSGGADKKETFERLIQEKKLGYMALMRNLRNMDQAGCDRKLIKKALLEGANGRVLPFRYISAAKAAPAFESDLDAAMIRSLEKMPKLPGRTLLVVDVSGSMYGSPVSRKSDMDRAQAACALASLVRGVCEDPVIYATAGNDYTRQHKTQLVPSRHGMALAEAVYNLCVPLGGGGIFINPVCRWLSEREKDVDRMIIITDEQDCSRDGKDSPIHAKPLGKHNYMINVATYQNGIGYRGRWTHINGFSESVISFIAENERILTQ